VSEAAVGAFPTEPRDGLGRRVEFLEAFRGGEVEEEAFMVGIQVGYPFGFDDLVVELGDFSVGERVVEGDETAHGFSGVEGVDPEGFFLRHRLVPPCHGCNDYYHHHFTCLGFWCCGFYV